MAGNHLAHYLHTWDLFYPSNPSWRGTILYKGLLRASTLKSIPHVLHFLITLTPVCYGSDLFVCTLGICSLVWTASHHFCVITLLYGFVVRLVLYDSAVFQRCLVTCLDQDVSVSRVYYFWPQAFRLAWLPVISWCCFSLLQKEPPTWLASPSWDHSEELGSRLKPSHECWRSSNGTSLLLSGQQKQTFALDAHC